MTGRQRDATGRNERSPDDRVIPERLLASAAASLDYDHIPLPVRKAVRDLFLDWLGSALAGSSAAPVRALLRAAEHLGGPGLGALAGPYRDCTRRDPAGFATVISTLMSAAPAWAALVNGAAGHVVEMDDLHNASIYHPGTCVFPAALAVAEAEGTGVHEFLAAAVAGYEVSLRVGEALGPEHYAHFHTTGTAGTFGAAVAAGRLLRLDPQQMLWALGSAGTQAAGLWQFLDDASMSKQLHPAKAAFNGLLSAFSARAGLTGTEEVLCGGKGLIPATTAAGAAATIPAPSGPPSGRESLAARQRARLLQGVEQRPGHAAGEPAAGTRPAEGGPRRPPEGRRASTSDGFFVVFKTPEVSFKYHASCRHTHPVVDALLDALHAGSISPEDIVRIQAHVYSGAFERLKDVVPSSPWAAKFSIPFCLASAAQYGRLRVESFTDQALQDPLIHGLMSKVHVSADASLDRLYPRVWTSWVEIETRDGRVHTARVEAPKGDPENPLTQDELDDKFVRLAAGHLGERQAVALLGRLHRLDELRAMSDLLAGLTPCATASSGDGA